MAHLSSPARALYRATRILHTFSPVLPVSRSAPLARPLSIFSTSRSPSPAMSDSSPTHSGFQLPSDAPKGSAPIQLYSLATPNGQKVGIMLEELGLQYDAHLVDISKNTQFEEWFKGINPNSKIPSLVDLDGPDGKPIAVFETAAIMIYLAEKTGKFLPRHGAARYAVLQWLEWQMGGIGPMLGQVNHFYNYAPEKLPYAQKRYLTEAKRLVAVLDKQLAQHTHVAGADYSIADMAILPWVDYFLKAHGDKLEGATYPNVDRWREELKDRPAVRKGYLVCKKEDVWWRCEAGAGKGLDIMKCDR